MQKLDYKKEYKDLYQPSSKPTIINIPEMLFMQWKAKAIRTPVRNTVKRLKYSMVCRTL